MAKLEIPWRALATRAVVDVAFVAGALSLATLLADTWWPLELLAHFHGCYGLVLIACSATLLLLRARFAGLLAAGVAAVDLAFVVPLWFGGDACDGPRDLRLLAANVHVASGSYEEFLAVVTAEQPDVVVVFEFGRGWQEALAVLDEPYPLHVAEPRRDAFGMACWSRIPCAHLAIVESDAGVPSLEVELRGAFGRLTLLAAHPPRPGLTGPPTARDAELLRIAERAARAEPPVVVFGDFNTTASSRVFREMLVCAELRDARRGFGPCPTWPGHLAAVGIAIDHVLVGAGVGVVDYRVGPYIGSDHRPVIVDLSLRQGAR